jgi:hypothetical protein
MTKRDNNPTRRLLRLKVAAEYLSLSPGSLRRIIQRGEIMVIRPTEGERVPWLVDVRDLDVWVEKTKASL